MRLALPQPYRDLDHTADVGVAVEGASPEEALARLVLAQSALLCGGGPVAAGQVARVAAAGRGRAAVSVALLRELLFRFATERDLPAWCEVRAFDEAAAEVEVGLGRWDPALHGEGLDLKAVTWHAARFERDGAVWRAQVIWDI